MLVKFFLCLCVLIICGKCQVWGGGGVFSFSLGGLRVTKPTIRLVCPSVCPSVRPSVRLSVRLSVRQHFACKHDNLTNINRIGPKLIPWMYLKSVLVKFEDG